MSSEQAGGGRDDAERLQKTLARAGYGSRRACEDLIRRGRVRVNGTVAVLGGRVDPMMDRVFVDGVLIPARPDTRYLALNKPAGVTSTMRDRHAEHPVTGLIPRGPRVVPVGRLDKDTEGLLLLTNDGEVAHRLQHPRYGIEREYIVGVDGGVPDSVLRRLVKGVDLEDGIARAASARKLQEAGGRTSLRMVMNEGRKREIRRMCAVLGHPVRRLVRVRFGPVRLGRLPPGGSRQLSRDEIREVYRLVGLTDGSDIFP